MDHSSNRRHFLKGSAAAALAGPRPSFAAAGKLRAGAATANITPALGCSLAGGMTDRRATEVHDELHVLNVAVDPAQRRRGVARAVMEATLDTGRNSSFGVGFTWF